MCIRDRVLHRLLAEVVVDPEDGVRREHLADHLVERIGAGQVVPERLLDDHPAPLAWRWLRQPRDGELAADLGERGRRYGQVERVVAVGAALRVELLDGVPQPGERGVVAEVTLDEADALGQGAPDLFTERRPSVLAHRVVDDLGEVLAVPVTSGETGERETRW